MGPRVSRLAAPYVPRRPQETVLYALVKEHLEDFLQHARESYAGRGDAARHAAHRPRARRRFARRRGPRYPLLRFHGVVAPRHRWRNRIVPRPPVHRAGSPKCKAERPELERERTSAAAHRPPSPHERGDGPAAFAVEACTVATASLLSAGVAEHIAPHVLSLAHWARTSRRRALRHELTAGLADPSQANVRPRPSRLCWLRR